MTCQYEHGCVRMAVDNPAGLCAEHWDMLNPERLQIRVPSDQVVITDTVSFAQSVVKLAEALNEVAAHITIEEGT